MDLQASSSDQSNEVCSALDIKYKTYQHNIESEEISMSIFTTNYTQFLNWIISLDAIRMHKTCYRCGEIMAITREEEKNEVWRCTSGNIECESFRTDDRFCFDLNIPLPILFGFLYLFYRNKNEEELISISSVTLEDYGHIKKLLTEVCIKKCLEGSTMIGGPNIRVNVEIGRKGGINAPDNVVICGVCEDDETQYFYFILNNENPSYSEVKTRLATWLKPDSIVFTSSEDYEFIEDFKWNKKNNWSLIIQSGCLAKDLWVHIHLQFKDSFDRFIRDVLNYFRKI